MSMMEAFDAAAEPPSPELPRFVGTSWKGIDRPANGKPFDLSWEEMAQRLENPAAAGDTPKKHLKVLCLAHFREWTKEEAEALAESKGEPPPRPGKWGPRYRSGRTIERIYGLALDLTKLPRSGSARPSRGGLSWPTQAQATNLKCPPGACSCR